MTGLLGAVVKARSTPARPPTRSAARRDPGDLAALTGWLAARMPALTDARYEGAKPCLYTITPDEDFVLGPHPAAADVSVAAASPDTGSSSPRWSARSSRTWRDRLHAHPIGLFAPGRRSSARLSRTPGECAPTRTRPGCWPGTRLDAWLGDPRRFHPVAGFGRPPRALERRALRADRTAGAALHRHRGRRARRPRRARRALATRRRPVARAAVVPRATWTVLGGRTLRREAAVMAGAPRRAATCRPPGGRLNHLCGRDPSTLDEPELARATVESVAENTSDAVVAPLFWGAVAGLPGLLGYRAANTLDAMVGHRSARYARFGTAVGPARRRAQPGPVAADRRC